MSEDYISEAEKSYQAALSLAEPSASFSDRKIKERQKRESLRIPETVDLDAFAEDIDKNKIISACEFNQQVWDYLHRTDEEIGAVLPWNKTRDSIRIRPGELSIWAGKRGEGKSLLTSMVILGLLMQNHKAVIASMEMPSEDTLSRMERQGLGLESPSREYHDEYFKYLLGRLWLFDQSGVVQAKRIIGLCRYAATEMKCQHVVIDSLMMIGFGRIHSMFEKLEAQIEFARTLAAIARDTGIHIHLICHLKKGDGNRRLSEADDVKGAGELTDLASCVYLLNGNRDKREEAQKGPGIWDDEIMAEPDLYLTVEKNRRGAPGTRHAFWLHEKSLQFLPKRSITAMEMLRSVLPKSSFGTS